MARSISTIKQQILDEKANQPSLAGLTSNSAVAVYNLWAHICAVGINLFEQLLDIFKAEIETKLSVNIVPSDSWLAQKVREFQYDASNPQVVQLIDYAPSYPVVNTALRIITRASVRTTAGRTVTVNVAKSEPPVALSAPEKAALEDYLTNGGNGIIAGVGIGFAGILIKVKSDTADKMYLKATVYFAGQYAGVISANVLLGLSAYMANIPFDGLVSVTDLRNALIYRSNTDGTFTGIEGVTDILIEDFAIRADATSFSNRTSLIVAGDQQMITYPLFAGYVVEETTGGQDFTTNLTFIAV